MIDMDEGGVMAESIVVVELVVKAADVDKGEGATVFLAMSLKFHDEPLTGFCVLRLLQSTTPAIANPPVKQYSRKYFMLKTSVKKVSSGPK